ncbi:ABC transporter substrate-binding protein [Klebsiella sp. WOUb02]|uniref:ABC transporter substrate-binding protein n=1 Tax=Klebsiella sp. WOUb02 TaxID=3161071 RepID=UPI003CF19249
MKKLFILFVMLAGLLPQLSVADGKVRIGYWTSGVSLGYGAVLESQDFLKKRGVDAEFIHFPDVNAPLKALASGSIDLAFGAPVAGVFSVAAEGLPVKIFAATQPADVAFVVPEGSPITELSQTQRQKSGDVSRWLFRGRDWQHPVTGKCGYCREPVFTGGRQ